MVLFYVFFYYGKVDIIKKLVKFMSFRGNDVVKIDLIVIIFIDT